MTERDLFSHHHPQTAIVLRKVIDAPMATTADAPTAVEIAFVDFVVAGYSFAKAYMLATDEGSVLDPQDVARVAEKAAALRTRPQVENLLRTRLHRLRQDMVLEGERLRRKIDTVLEGMLDDEDVKPSVKLAAATRLGARTHVRAFDPPAQREDDSGKFKGSAEVLEQIKKLVKGNPE